MLQKEPVLHNRTWRNVKDFLRNSKSPDARHGASISKSINFTTANDCAVGAEKSAANDGAVGRLKKSAAKHVTVSAEKFAANVGADTLEISPANDGAVDKSQEVCRKEEMDLKSRIENTGAEKRGGERTGSLSSSEIKMLWRCFASALHEMTK